MLQEMKDKALAVAIRTFVNERYGKYGHIEDIQIDTHRNRFTMQALLKGEIAPVTAVVEQYDFEKRDGEVFLVLKRISASREWLSNLLAELATGKQFKLPGALAAIL